MNPQKLCSLWIQDDCYRTESRVHIINDAFNYKALTSVLLSMVLLRQKVKYLVNININYHIISLYQYFQEKKKIISITTCIMSLLSSVTKSENFMEDIVSLQETLKILYIL